MSTNQNTGISRSALEYSFEVDNLRNVEMYYTKTIVY